MNVPLLFLKKEWRETWWNKYLLPVLIILPVIAAALPIAFVSIAPTFVRMSLEKNDPVITLVQQIIHASGEYAGLSLEEAVTRYLLRNLLAFYLLMPLGLSSTAAAFSIVAEKQQRTLEPILATPITDLQLLLGKVLVAATPSILVTWATAIFTAIIIDLIAWPRYGLLLPDRFWFLAIFVLAPLMCMAAVLATMRFSARMTDAQAANQFTGLVIIPIFILLIGLFGKTLTISIYAVITACLLALLLNLWLWRINLRRFQREEILTRWK